MTKREIENRGRVYDRLHALGFETFEIDQLFRIERALQRWAERECGDGSDWAIERNEETGKPFLVYHGQHAGKNYYAFKPQALQDREASSLKRLSKIVGDRNARCDEAVIEYHQGAPRGCQVYIVPVAELRGGADIHSVYTRGVAVCS